MRAWRCLSPVVLSVRHAVLRIIVRAAWRKRTRSHRHPSRIADSTHSCRTRQPASPVRESRSRSCHSRPTSWPRRHRCPLGAAIANRVRREPESLLADRHNHWHPRKKDHWWPIGIRSPLGSECNWHDLRAGDMAHLIPLPPHPDSRKVSPSHPPKAVEHNNRTKHPADSALVCNVERNSETYPFREHRQESQYGQGIREVRHYGASAVLWVEAPCSLLRIIEESKTALTR